MGERIIYPSSVVLSDSNVYDNCRGRGHADMPMWDEHVVKMVRMNILYIKHYILNNSAIFLRAGDCGSAFFH